MFHAIQNMSFPNILSGIIWATVLGFAVGNYACSLVHRLPRGRLLLDKTPYCGNCGTLLKVKDLFPVFSALLLKHRCRYCGVKFPVSHTWTEVLVGLLFVLAFFQYNFSEQFILIVGVGVFLITVAAIHANENIIMGKVLLCAVIFGMLLRVLQDGSIYPFFAGGLDGLIIGLVLKRKEIKPVGHIYSLPKLAELLAAGGIIVGFNNLILFLGLLLILYVLSKASKRIPFTVPFGLAVTLTLLYPQVATLL